MRECVEEAGIAVELRGVLRVEHSPSATHARLRVIFYAEPCDATQAPKSIPDAESRGARWVNAFQLDGFRMRGPEPREWFTYLARGGPVFPLALFVREIAPVPIEANAGAPVCDVEHSAASESEKSAESQEDENNATILTRIC